MLKSVAEGLEANGRGLLYVCRLALEEPGRLAARGIICRLSSRGNVGALCVINLTFAPHVAWHWFSYMQRLCGMHVAGTCVPPLAVASVARGVPNEPTLFLARPVYYLPPPPYDSELNVTRNNAYPLGQKYQARQAAGLHQLPP